MTKGKKQKKEPSLLNLSTADLACLLVAIDSSRFWENEDGFPTALRVLVKDPQKFIEQLSKDIGGELERRGILTEGLK